MDERFKTLQLSAAPDHYHNYRVILFGIGALLLFLIGGGLGFYYGLKNPQLSLQSSVQHLATNPEKPMFDCGNNQNCYTKNLLTCTRTNGSLVVPVPFVPSGYYSSVEYYLEIRGITNGKCTVYQRVNKINLISNTPIPQPTIDSWLKQAYPQKGMYGICTYPMEYIPYYISHLNNSDERTTAAMKTYCIGTLYQIFKK